MTTRFRNIIGRCYRVDTRPHYPREIKEYRYSVESREDVTTITRFAWRMSCGHVVDGQRAHGLKKKVCYDCETLAPGYPWADPGDSERIAEFSAAWTDIPDEAAYEALRLKAQS